MDASKASTMREGRVERETSETKIVVEIRLDGAGRGEVATGVGIFDHMLEQLARHSGVSIMVHAEGDRHIDDHHTVEDVGIALGQALRQALGDRRGIMRYGDCLLPMDEALTRAALDVSGRPFLVFSAPFLRRLTRHVDSGEPLDDATIDRIVASRNFMVGNATLRQLQFARTDLVLHQRYGVAGANESRTPFEIERDIAEEALLVPRLADETQLPSFGHLFAGGYAAGYYSYKWAEVLAADAFAAFREAGLDDEQAVRSVAERFRDTVLGLGGSLPAADVYRRFRGRDATPDALLAEQGLS
jgi:hypothetical protein